MYRQALELRQGRAFAGTLEKWEQDMMTWRCSLTPASAAELGAGPGWNCRDVDFRLDMISFADLKDEKFKDLGKAPPALVNNLRHNKVLHKTTLIVSVDTDEAPRVEPEVSGPRGHARVDPRPGGVGRRSRRVLTGRGRRGGRRCRRAASLPN